MDDIDPKLLKVVALAREGIGGEKETATRMVRKICKEQGIDFDVLMSGRDQPRSFEYWTKVRSKSELRVCIQVAARFATTPEHPNVFGRYSSYDKEVRLEYTTTMPKHVETLNALDVYLRAFRKEKKKILEALGDAFTSRHGLYSQFREEPDEDAEPEKPETLEEKQARWRAANLAEAMLENVQVTKQIGEGEDEK